MTNMPQTILTIARTPLATVLVAIITIATCSCATTQYSTFPSAEPTSTAIPRHNQIPPVAENGKGHGLGQNVRQGELLPINRDWKIPGRSEAKPKALPGKTFTQTGCVENALGNFQRPGDSRNPRRQCSLEASDDRFSVSIKGPLAEIRIKHRDPGTAASLSYCLAETRDTKEVFVCWEHFGDAPRIQGKRESIICKTQSLYGHRPMPGHTITIRSKQDGREFTAQGTVALALSTRFGQIEGTLDFALTVPQGTSVPQWVLQHLEEKKKRYVDSAVDSTLEQEGIERIPWSLGQKEDPSYLFDEGIPVFLGEIYHPGKVRMAVMQLEEGVSSMKDFYPDGIDCGFRLVLP